MSFFRVQISLATHLTLADARGMCKDGGSLPRRGVTWNWSRTSKAGALGDFKRSREGHRMARKVLQGVMFSIHKGSTSQS